MTSFISLNNTQNHPLLPHGRSPSLAELSLLLLDLSNTLVEELSVLSLVFLSVLCVLRFGLQVNVQQPPSGSRIGGA